MKSFNVALGFVCLFSMALASCDKIEDLIVFKIEDTTQFTIPANTIIELPVDILTPGSEVDLTTELENNDSRKDKIKTIRLDKLHLTITSPPDKTFSFLNSIKLYILVDGLPEKQIGELLNIPANVGGVIKLDTFNDDLAEYIKEERIRIRARVETDEAITQNIQVEVFSSFRVTADIF